MSWGLWRDESYEGDHHVRFIITISERHCLVDGKHTTCIDLSTAVSIVALDEPYISKHVPHLRVRAVALASGHCQEHIGSCNPASIRLRESRFTKSFISTVFCRYTSIPQFANVRWIITITKLPADATSGVSTAQRVLSGNPQGQHIAYTRTSPGF